MSEYQVAVPSYRRPDTINTKTLRFLADGGVTADRVTVYVVDADEAAAYRVAVDPGLCARIEITAVGLGASRSAYLRRYPEGTGLWSCDDDVTGLRRKLDDRTAVPLTDVAGWMAATLTSAALHGARLCGPYPTVNPMFMSTGPTTKLCLIAGPCWGCVVTHDGTLDTSTALDLIEDHQRTIRCWLADGAIWRDNQVGVLTRYWTNPGGLPRTLIAQARAAVTLAGMYPDLVAVRRKRGGLVDVRFRRQP